MPTQATAAVFATHTRKPAEGRGFVSPFIGSAFAALTRRRVAVNSLYSAAAGFSRVTPGGIRAPGSLSVSVLRQAVNS